MIIKNNRGHYTVLLKWDPNLSAMTAELPFNFSVVTLLPHVPDGEPEDLSSKLQIWMTGLGADALIATMPSFVARGGADIAGLVREGAVIQARVTFERKPSRDVFLKVAHLVPPWVDGQGRMSRG